MLKLAEHLHMTVGDLLKRADSRELNEWRALFLLRERDALRKDLDAKVLAASHHQR